MKRPDAARRYEATTISVDGSKLRVLRVVESSRRFFTAYVQRINRDGAIDRRDVAGYGRLRTIAHSVVEEVTGASHSSRTVEAGPGGSRADRATNDSQKGNS